MTIPGWHRDYIGIPFAEHGRDRSGSDCWGLARLIWREQAGLELPCWGTVYGSTRDGAAVAAAVRAAVDAEEWIEVSEGSERLLDGVLMKGWTQDPESGELRAADMHVGVVLAPGAVIHVERGVNAALGFYRSDPRLTRRVLGFYRPRELADA